MFLERAQSPDDHTISRERVQAWSAATLGETAPYCKSVLSERSRRATWFCHGNYAGVVVIVDVAETEWSMILRIGGPHPQTAQFRRATQLSRTAWMANFQVCEAGTYTVFVLAIMPNPWPNDPARGDPFQSVDSTTKGISLIGSKASCFAPENGIWTRNFSVMHVRTSATCDITERRLWSWRPPRSDEGFEVQQTARASLSVPRLVPHPWRHELEHMFGDLIWAGRGVLQKTWANNASRHLPVCLLGDSTVRNLHNALLKRTEGVPVCDVVAAQTNYAACNASATGGMTGPVYYIEVKRLGPPFTMQALSTSLEQRVSKKSLQRCGAIALNSGQWIAAGQAGPCWTPAAYRRIAGGMMDWLSSIGAKLGVPVAWMATQPFPLNRGGHGHVSDQRPAQARSSNLANCPPTDWRYPHVLRAYNQGAQAAACERNLTFIDLWTAASHVSELSFDGMHYATGPLGDLHAALIADWVTAPSDADRGCSASWV